MGVREVKPATAKHAPRTRSYPLARHSDQRGVAALEFALVLPVLLTLLMGTASIALLYSNHLAMWNAVREGARLGAAAPANADWATSVRSRTELVYAEGNNNLTDASVCVQLVKIDASGTHTVTQQTLGADCAADDPYDSAEPVGVSSACVVKVWAVRPTELFWGFGGRSVTLQAQSMAMYDRDTPC